MTTSGSRGYAHNPHEKLDTIKESGRSEEDLLAEGAAAYMTYEEPVTSSNPPCTNIDDVALHESHDHQIGGGGGGGGGGEPFYHTLDSPKQTDMHTAPNRYYSPKKTPPWKKKKVPGAGSTSGSRSNSPSVKGGAAGVVNDMPSNTPSVSALKARLYESNPNQTHFARVNKSLAAQSGVPKKLTLYGKSPTNSNPASPRSPRSPTEMLLSPRERKEESGNGSDREGLGEKAAAVDSARSLSDSYHTKAMNAIKVKD